MHADGAAQVLDILVSEANRENLGSVYFDTILCSSTKEALAVAEARGKDVQLVLLDVLMAPGEERGALDDGPAVDDVGDDAAPAHHLHREQADAQLADPLRRRRAL